MSSASVSSANGTSWADVRGPAPALQSIFGRGPGRLAGWSLRRTERRSERGGLIAFRFVRVAVFGIEWKRREKHRVLFGTANSIPSRCLIRSPSKPSSPSPAVSSLSLLPSQNGAQFVRDSLLDFLPLGSSQTSLQAVLRQSQPLPLRPSVRPKCKHSLPSLISPPDISQPWHAASNADPLKSIESRLLPHDSRSPSTSYYSSSAHTFLPPVLHAGWPIDEHALLHWCSTEGFDRTTYDINDRPVFDYRSTVASALAYLAQRAGLLPLSDPYSRSSPSSTDDEVEILPYVQSTCNHKAPLIIALVSNYDIQGVKRLGSIKSKIYAFGRLLFREGLLDVHDTDPGWSKSCIESPMWYLDYNHWQWVPVPKEGLGSSKNPPSASIDVRLKVKVPLKSKTSNSALGPANRKLDALKSTSN